jgi:hypothetical protein
MTPVLSAADTVWHQPDGSPRRYLLAPLTRLERNRFRREMVALGARYPAPVLVWEELRAALREIAPGNLDELLALVDAAEAEDTAGTRGEAMARIAPVERAAMAVPGFAAMIADRQFWLDTYPMAVTALALRDWEGGNLPAFARRNGTVSLDLLEAIPDEDLREIGARAYEMAFLSRRAEGNSEPPSLSPEIPAPSMAG